VAPVAFRSRWEPVFLHELVDDGDRENIVATLSDGPRYGGQIAIRAFDGGALIQRWQHQDGARRVCPEVGVIIGFDGLTSGEQEYAGRIARQRLWIGMLMVFFHVGEQPVDEHCRLGELGLLGHELLAAWSPLPTW